MCGGKREDRLRLGDDGADGAGQCVSGMLEIDFQLPVLGGKFGGDAMGQVVLGQLLQASVR